MRLVTRGDLDGLVSAVLITTMESVDGLELIHPQDITDDKFPVRSGDIIANLPYHPACSLWFDHHELTDSNRKPPTDFKGKHALHPSAARVAYEYYSSEKLNRYATLVSETDRFDSAQLSLDDVSNPKGAILLGFTIDPRTGFGIDSKFFMTMVELFKTAAMDEVLLHPEVARRIAVYQENDTKCLQALKSHSRREKNVIITDFRPLAAIPPGNRFLIYLIYPVGNVSVRLQWGPQRRFIAVTIGHSIFNRTCEIDIGRLCSDYGGGGHRGAGACTLHPSTAEAKISEIVRRLQE
jgi:hypothetical protein